MTHPTCYKLSHEPKKHDKKYGWFTGINIHHAKKHWQTYKNSREGISNITSRLLYATTAFKGYF